MASTFFKNMASRHKNHPKNDHFWSFLMRNFCKITNCFGMRSTLYKTTAPSQTQNYSLHICGKSRQKCINAFLAKNLPKLNVFIFCILQKIMHFCLFWSFLTIFWGLRDLHFWLKACQVLYYFLKNDVKHHKSAQHSFFSGLDFNLVFLNLFKKWPKLALQSAHSFNNFLTKYHSSESCAPKTTPKNDKFCQIFDNFLSFWRFLVCQVLCARAAKCPYQPLRR